MPPAPLAYLRRAAALGLVIVVPAVAVVGCGGDEDVERALKRFATSRTVADRCERTVSSALVREIYGSRSRCRTVEKRDSDVKPPQSADVGDVEVEGGTASAELRLEGGDYDGVRGRVTLIEEGGLWKVDRLGYEYLRSLATYGDDPADSRLERRQFDCAQRVLRTLRGDRFRAVMHAVLGTRTADLPERLVLCFSGPRRLRRDVLAAGIDAGLASRGLPAGRAACAKRRILSLFGNDELYEMVGSGDYKSRLRGLVRASVRLC